MVMRLPEDQLSVTREKMHAILQSQWVEERELIFGHDKLRLVHHQILIW